MSNLSKGESGALDTWGSLKQFSVFICTAEIFHMERVWLNDNSMHGSSCKSLNDLTSGIPSFVVTESKNNDICFVGFL